MINDIELLEYSFEIEKKKKCTCRRYFQDMDENYSLALGEKTLSSPSQSMLAPFIPVYGHCNYASSSLLLYMSLWIPHSPSFFKRSLPFSSLFSSSFFSCKNQSSSLIYPIINSIIIWDDKRIGIIFQENLGS